MKMNIREISIMTKSLKLIHVRTNVHKGRDADEFSILCEHPGNFLQFKKIFPTKGQLLTSSHLL